jgi:hypothetical protein
LKPREFAAGGTYRVQEPWTIMCGSRGRAARRTCVCISGSGWRGGRGKSRPLGARALELRRRRLCQELGQPKRAHRSGGELRRACAIAGVGVQGCRTGCTRGCAGTS